MNAELAEPLHGDVLPGLYLGDGELRSKEHPETFKIPSKDAREGLLPRDFAKLMFLARSPVKGCDGERIWVVVLERKEGDRPLRYTGKIANQGALYAIPLDGVVEFEPRHVIDLALTSFQETS